MSSGESSPPYEPSQPATASTSMPMQQKISFAIVPPSVVGWYNADDNVRALRSPARASTGPSRKAAAAARVFRVALLNRVLDHFGLRLDDWSGRVYVLRDRKGRSAVVANLGALWVEAERLAGAPARPARPRPRRARLR